jgi:hypothetical protein
MDTKIEVADDAFLNAIYRCAIQNHNDTKIFDTSTVAAT